MKTLFLALALVVTSASANWMDVYDGAWFVPEPLTEEENYLMFDEELYKPLPVLLIEADPEVEAWRETNGYWDY